MQEYFSQLIQYFITGSKIYYIKSEYEEANNLLLTAKKVNEKMKNKVNIRIL